MRGITAWSIVLPLLALAGSCSSSVGGSAAPDVDGGPDDVPAPVCMSMLLADDFEQYAAGAPLGAPWQVSVQGPNSSARVNLDAEGHGNGGSARYVLLTNAGSEPNSVQISVASGPLDARGCGSVRLTFAVIVFSLEETENDHAFVEVRGNGNDWTPMYMPFPSPDFPPIASCRAGGQETGCVAWKTFAVDVPNVMIGPDLEVRFRLQTLTDASDFFGFDDVSVVGAP